MWVKALILWLLAILKVMHLIRWLRDARQVVPLMPLRQAMQDLLVEHLIPLELASSKIMCLTPWLLVEPEAIHLIHWPQVELKVMTIISHKA